MDSRSDKELLQAHIRGESGCFELLTERYVRDLYGFLYRFVGDAVMAEDLVQEAFLQVHLASGSFDFARPFKPWLYTIAANKARDMLRSRTRRQERSLDAPTGGVDGESTGMADTVEAFGASAEDQIDTSERAELVRSLISRMPEHLRLILMLGYYQQLPYAEIAEILGIPVGTVKSRLHSAIGYFARLWDRQTRNPAANHSRAAS